MPERSRRPGPAVLLVLLYGLLFLAALFLLRAKSPLFHRKPHPTPRVEFAVSGFGIPEENGVS